MIDSEARFTAVVTGSSSGIGEAASRLFLKEGYRVIGIDKSIATISEKRYDHHTCDICDFDAVAKVFKQLNNEGTVVNYLVNCAGVFFHELRPAVEQIVPRELESVLMVNLVGATQVTRECIPLMHGSGDKAIAFVSSDQVAYPRPNNSIYATSKGGLEAYARSCASELKDAGIRANIIEAASVKTNFIEKLAGNESRMQEIYRRVDHSMPFGIILPEDVAEALLFFCSPRARRITGQTLLISGGLYV